MLLAARTGNLNEIQTMVSTGADVNVDFPSYTPLSGASFNGHKEVAEYLIEHGATLDSTNFIGGSTPLYWAVRGDSKEVIKLLLDKGANVNIVTSEGRLISLVRSEAALQLLLDKGATLNVPDDKRPPLHVAAYRGNLEVAKALLAHGAQPNLHNSWGATPLHEAVRSELDNHEMVKLLILHGADVHAKNGSGDTPLHTAVGGFTGCMDGLIPFWMKIAIVNRRLDMAKILLAHGASISATNTLGQTPLAKAKDEQNTKASSFLKAHGAKR
jgi:ankyrin repeat protein